MKKLMILFAALFLVGCGQATDEVTPLEPETVEQEEVQETEETEVETEDEAEEEASPEEVSSEEAATAGDQLGDQADDDPEEDTAVQPETVQNQNPSVSSEEAAVESEEDLDYDGDLGDADLYPDQPMFIDGVLHSGDTSGISADMVVTADELRAGGYTVYELSQEDYNQLVQDINNGVIPYEEALSHYLSNY